MKKTLLLLFALTIVSCTTAYGPQGLTGGYKERMLDENSYIISFFGNGNTGEQQVWNYWMYRCAELTLEKGYDLFTLLPSDEHAFYPENYKNTNLVSFKMLDQQENLQSNFAPVYYYYQTITTYSSKAIIDMYKLPVDQKMGLMDKLIDAKTIIASLKPYVESEAKIEAPDRKNLLIRARIEAAIKANMINEQEAEGLKKILL